MTTLPKLRVLVTFAETEIWVAQALEQDLATQVSPGESALSAVAALGRLFDDHDTTSAMYAAQHITVVPPLAAPASYHRLWERGTPIGEHPLGSSRVAEVRSCDRRS